MQARRRIATSQVVLLVGTVLSFLVPLALQRTAPLPEAVEPFLPPRAPSATVQHAPAPGEALHASVELELGAELSGAILQDRDGFLWVGTFGAGLYRFDGRKSLRFGASGGELASSNVTALFEDDQGVLWIGTLAGLDTYDKRTGTFAHVPLATGGDEGVWSIAAGADGHLWIGTNGHGLVEFDPASGAAQVFDASGWPGAGVPHDSIYKLEPAADGGLWLATFGGGVAHFDPAARRVDWARDVTGGLPSDQVWSVREDPAGRVWVGTQEGLVRFESREAEPVLYAFEPGDPETIGGDVVTDARPDTHGRVWVTTFNGEASLALLDVASGRAERLGPAQGVGRRGARTVFEDAGGVFRVVMMGGLHAFDRARMGFSMTHLSSGLLPIFEDARGTMWLGTMEGLRRFDRATGKLAHVEDPRVATQLVSAMTQDTAGRFWLATYGGELLEFDLDTRRVVRAFEHDPNDPRSLPASNCIRRIHEDVTAPGVLWLSTQGGGLARFDTASGTCQRFQNDPGDPFSLSSDTASYGALWQDPDGTLWVGTDGGLNVKPPGVATFARVMAGEGAGDLRSNVIQVLHRDRAGRLWVATDDGLHELVDPERMRFRAFTVEDGLPDNMIVGLLEADERLWLSTPAGLVALDPEGRRAPQVFGREEGLDSETFLPTSFFKTADGELWFGGAAGVNHFRPSAIAADPFVPPVALTSLTSGGEPLLDAGDPVRAREVRLAWPTNAFEFEVAALSYAMPTFNRYRYRLVGVDEDWFESARGFGRYSGLAGGQYLLEVQGANASGVWNPTSRRLRVDVEPSLMGSVPFRIALLLALTFLVSGWMHYIQLLRSEVVQRREAEQSRDLAEQRLRESTRVEALGRLASGVAHDFNNLLMVILGEIDLLRLEPGMASELSAALDVIESAAQRGSDLTGQLLAFSSRRRTEKQSVDLNAVVQRSQRFFERVLGDDIELAFELDERARPVHADPVKIQQVLMNLVVNASHAMPSGGRLAIRTAPVELDGAEGVRLSVADSGCGITPEVRGRIFDPYFTTKRAGEGTGLGLAIVKEVVEQHDGRIEVESALGAGTRFELSFPATDEPLVVAPEVEALPAAPAPEPPRVLLLEDDNALRALMARELESGGYEVVAVGHGIHALAEWERAGHDFALLLSDIVVPDLRGDEVAARLRADDPELPVLFVSGYTPSGINITPPGAGPWSTLAKPVRKRELLEAVDGILRIARARHLIDSAPHGA